jgi:hypothetical protein
LIVIDSTTERVEAQARGLYETSPSFCEPWEELPEDERGYYRELARQDIESEANVFGHVEDSKTRRSLEATFDKVVERECYDFILAPKHRSVRLFQRPRRVLHMRRARTRAPRSRRKTAANTSTGTSGDGDSGQGGPDSSDPPKPHLVAPFTQQSHSSPSPCPSHGCCCFASERGRSA